ncbi:hypothetical protein E4U40_007281 [Claviceps sp. LM458 group G5]|nr:hypothetical protein E4U40_007281 [Claviceps sp. LM458 group G5]
MTIDESAGTDWEIFVGPFIGQVLTQTHRDKSRRQWVVLEASGQLLRFCQRFWQRLPTEQVGPGGAWRT